MIVKTLMNLFYTGIMHWHSLSISDPKIHAEFQTFLRGTKA